MIFVPMFCILIKICCSPFFSLEWKDLYQWCTRWYDEGMIYFRVEYDLCIVQIYIELISINTVSYTHLTLPTSDLV